MTQATPLATATTPALAGWNEEILGELLTLHYVRAVVFTNGSGRAIQVNQRRAAPPQLAKVADLALAALTQTGSALQVGRLEVSANVYEEGVVVLAGAGALRVAVLTDSGANLGTLLNQVRRLFRQEEAA